MSLAKQHHLITLILAALAVLLMFPFGGMFGTVFFMLGALFNVGLAGYRDIMAKKDAHA